MVELGRTLMIQGTASSVGKSLLVAGLCRYFKQLGLRVAPFKSQNMALNSFATPEGLEIGRAQAMQAQAAGVAPHVDMNPILLKPEAEARAQVVVMGKPQGSFSAQAYHDRKREFGATIADALARLRARHDIVVIEGAGSPAEINLRDRDVANMFVAELADAPVMLVGDIDRGGVFASLLGTLMLLTPAERARVKALIVNKFRGDRRLLDSGIVMLEERAQCPVLGVVPYLRDLGIADEDSVALEDRRPAAPADERLDVAVVLFPYISNYDDVLPLENEPGVAVRFVGAVEEVGEPDLLILPGTKRTVGDMAWLRRQGLADVVAERVRQGQPVFGICGGYQMLGQAIADPLGIEGPAGEVEALGHLSCRTRFAADKVTRQVQALSCPSFVSDGEALSTTSAGYYIHMGRVELAADAQPLLRVDGVGEGCVAPHAPVAGTLQHGIFDHDRLRGQLIRYLRRRRGVLTPYQVRAHRPDDAFDRLAATLRDTLDPTLLHAIVGLEAHDGG